MRNFVDYKGSKIVLSVEAAEHIASAHSEIDFTQITAALIEPDEVRKSSYRASSILYYRLKTHKRFVCVVVKSCSDGNFISSAMTTTKPKSGEVIYVRKP